MGLPAQGRRRSAPASGPASHSGLAVGGRVGAGGLLVGAGFWTVGASGFTASVCPDLVAHVPELMFLLQLKTVRRVGGLEGVSGGTGQAGKERRREVGGRFRKEPFFKWAQGCGASCVPMSG